MKFVLVMEGHLARNRSVRCAVSRSGRATSETSCRGAPTAITNATSITAKPLSLRSSIMRCHPDTPGSGQTPRIFQLKCQPNSRWPQPTAIDDLPQDFVRIRLLLVDESRQYPVGKFHDRERLTPSQARALRDAHINRPSPACDGPAPATARGDR